MTQWPVLLKCTYYFVSIFQIDVAYTKSIQGVRKREAFVDQRHKKSCTQRAASDIIFAKNYLTTIL